jgi:hypothetical protein
LKFFEKSSFLLANQCVEIFIDIFDEQIFNLDNLIVDYVLIQNRAQKWPHGVDSTYMKLLRKVNLTNEKSEIKLNR